MRSAIISLDPAPCHLAPGCSHLPHPSDSASLLNSDGTYASA